MAKIIKTDLQLNALQDINKKLKLVEGMNYIYDSDSTECYIDLIRGNKKVHLQVELSELEKLIKDYRKNYINDIQKSANKFNIILDETDLNIINPDKNKLIENNTNIDGIESENYANW